MKVLVVNDSRAMRRVITDVMKEIGFEVLEAGNGIEALQRLDAEGAPDLVMVDWNMPQMNGLELIKAIRANPVFSDLPLMMVTSETELERLTLAFKAGVNDYVKKPFDKAAMVDKLQLLGIAV